MEKTAVLCDADECLSQEKAVKACSSPLRYWGLKPCFSGLIRTIRCHEDFGLIRKLLSAEGNGAVLVVDAGGTMERAVFGDTMAAYAIKNHWAGVVLNGVIRDTGEIDAMETGIHALGRFPKRGTATGAGEVDVPLSFGGVTFTPGKRLVADRDGVVVFP